MILNTKARRVEIYKNMIISSKLIYINKMFTYFRNMNIWKTKIPNRRRKNKGTNVVYGQTLVESNLDRVVPSVLLISS